MYLKDPQSYYMPPANQDLNLLVDQFNWGHQQMTQETDGVNGEGEQTATVTLHMEELEKVYEMFHSRPQSFADCQIRDTHTIVPSMTVNSMFFQCYSDDIFDTILEDLRDHYTTLCNE